MKLFQKQFALAASAALSLAYAAHFLTTLSAADVGGPASAVTAHEALAKRLTTAGAFTPRATVSDVVSRALAFESMLTSSQLATLQLTYTTTLARKWSNLPCTNTCRNGIGLGTLTADQLAAALAVIQAVEGTAADQGFSQFQEIRMADDILAAAQGSGGPGGLAYGSGLYYLAFLNAPSTTGAWMMQLGGHHYAANISFNGGHIVSATPFFYGLEPTTFTVNGTTYSPLQQEHDAMASLLASLSTTQLASAKLSQTFSDAVMIPGATNGGTDTFPTPKVGIPVSSLTDTQKQLVLAAMKPWVQDIEPNTAANLLAIYQGELNGTYVAWTGSGASGDASSFLNANTNYARIDGPSVWIEFVCQNGVVYRNQIHYHTVWRDHNRDYAKDLSLTTALDTTPSGGNPVTSTSAASYAVGSLAPEAIGALFGNSLASGTASASTNPLPTTLGNVQVQVTDISGVARTAPLFYVSPMQISYQMPAGTAAGSASINVTLNGSTVAQGTTIVQAVTPGLFAANSNGQGVAAAVALLVRSDGTQTMQPVLQLNSSTNQYEAVPLTAATGSDQLYLILFGTGFRNRSSLSNVSATIGGVSAQVAYAGAQGSFVGLDQANVVIPPGLAGRGNVDIILKVDGQSSNTVMINMK